MSVAHPFPQARELDASDSLRDQLAQAVEELNAEQDHDTRVVLIAAVCRLRELLGIVPVASRK